MSEELSASDQQLSPNQVADALPSRPILTTGEGLWDRATLQRYKHPPSLVELSPVRDHIIVLNLNGPTLLEEPLANGRTLRRWTDAGHMSVTPAGTSVTRRLNGRPDVLLLHVRSGLIEEVERLAYGEVFDLGQLPAQLAVPNEQMSHLSHLLLSEAENKDAPGQVEVSNLLVKSLIIQIIRRYKYEYALRSVQHSASADSRVERVLTFMREHFAEKITAEQLVSISGTSRSSFSRLFREAVGQSAYQHLTALRLEHAIRLLEETAISITQIAFESGFAEPTHFTTVFRERFGVSPRAWRNTNSAIKPSPPGIVGIERLSDNRRFLTQTRK